MNELREQLIDAAGALRALDVPADHPSVLLSGERYRRVIRLLEDAAHEIDHYERVLALMRQERRSLSEHAQADPARLTKTEGSQADGSATSSSSSSAPRVPGATP